MVILLKANIMNQEKLYHVAILQTNNTSTDKIWLINFTVFINFLGGKFAARDVQV